MATENIHVEIKGYPKQFLIENWKWQQSYGFFIKTFSRLGNEIRLYIVHKESISRSADIKTIELTDILKKSGKYWYLYQPGYTNERTVYDGKGNWIMDQKKINGKWRDD